MGETCSREEVRTAARKWRDHIDDEEIVYVHHLSNRVYSKRLLRAEAAGVPAEETSLNGLWGRFQSRVTLWRVPGAFSTLAAARWTEEREHIQALRDADADGEVILGAFRFDPVFYRVTDGGDVWAKCLAEGRESVRIKTLTREQTERAFIATSRMWSAMRDEAKK